MPIIKVPGQGNVKFPDDMKEEEIEAAIIEQWPELDAPAGGGDVLKSGLALGAQAYAEVGKFAAETLPKHAMSIVTGLPPEVTEYLTKPFTDPMVDVADEAAKSHAAVAEKYLPEYVEDKPITSTLRRAGAQGLGLLTETPLFMAGTGPGAKLATEGGKFITRHIPSLYKTAPAVVKETAKAATITGSQFAGESLLRGKDAEEIAKSGLTGVFVPIAGKLGAATKIPGMKTVAEALSLAGSAAVLHDEPFTPQTVSEVLAMLVELKVIGKVTGKTMGKMSDFGKAVALAKQRGRISEKEAEGLAKMDEQALSEAGVEALLKEAEQYATSHKEEIQTTIAGIRKQEAKAKQAEKKAARASKTIGKKQKGVFGVEKEEKLPETPNEEIYQKANDKFVRKAPVLTEEVSQHDANIAPLSVYTFARTGRAVKELKTEIFNFKNELAKETLTPEARVKLEKSLKERETDLSHIELVLKDLTYNKERKMTEGLEKVVERTLEDLQRETVTPRKPIAETVGKKQRGAIGEEGKTPQETTKEELTQQEYGKITGQQGPIAWQAKMIEQMVDSQRKELTLGNARGLSQAAYAPKQMINVLNKRIDELVNIRDTRAMHPNIAVQIPGKIAQYENLKKQIPGKLEKVLEEIQQEIHTRQVSDPKVLAVQRRIEQANGISDAWQSLSREQLMMAEEVTKRSLRELAQDQRTPLGQQSAFKGQQGAIKPEDLTPEALVRGIKVAQKEIKSVLDGMKVMKEYKGDRDGLLKEYNEQITRFGAFQANFLTILQIADRHPEVDGFTRPTKNVPLPYMEGIREFTHFQRKALLEKELLLEELQIAKKEDVKRAGQLLIDEVLAGKHLDKAAKEAYIKANKISPEALVLSEKLRNEFQKFMKSVAETVISEEFRKLQNAKAEDTVVQLRMKELEKDFAHMLEQPYFPFMREGRYAVKVTDPLGNTAQWTQHPNRVAQTHYKAKMNGVFGKKKGYKVTDHYIPDNVQAFAGFPPQLINKLIETGKFTKDQQAILRDIQYSYSPGRSFKNQLRRRKKTPGFSDDITHSYARYMYHGVKHLAKIKYGERLSEAVQEVRASQKVLEAAGASATGRGRLVSHLDKHLDYIMSSKNEWANLRALGFVWYLGFLPKAAFINLTQVPLVSYPHLAAKYGDAAASKELFLKASRDVLKVTKGTRYSKEEAAIMNRFLEDGLTNESFAATMAAVSNGSLLERVAPTTRVGRGAKSVMGKGAYLFTMAEEYNRRVTGLAAYRLAKKAGKTPDEAYIEARSSIEKTQFEYSSWNRPTFMRGKVKSNLFMFYQYLQNMLYFASRDPGNKRFLAILLAAGGVQGMPGAEDMMDMLDRMFSNKNNRYDSRKELREFVHNLGMNPDLMMHGTSRYGFGASWAMRQAGIPAPDVDLSGSLSMGRIIPGGEGFLAPGDKDFASMYADTSRDFLGAIFSVPLAYWQATEDTGLDELPWSLETAPRKIKQMEKMMPSFARAASKGLTIATEGKEKIGAMTFNYNEDLRYENFTPEEMIPLTAAFQVAGFAETQTNQRKERMFAARDTELFYKARRKDLLEAYSIAVAMKSSDQKKNVKKAIDLYNKEVPYSLMRITGQQLKQSIWNRIKRDAKLRHDVGDRSAIQIFKEAGKLYPQTEMITEEEIE